MNINTILRNIALGGVFLIPLIPLVVANQFFFPYITGKNFLFRIIVEIVAASWLILALRDVSYRPRRNLLLIVVSVFTLIVALADAFSANPLKSFWSNFERMEGFVTIAHLFLYFVVASTILTTEKLWTWFWRVSLFSALIAGLYAAMQSLGWFPMHQGDRPDSTLGNATYLGGYMLFHIFVASYYFLRAKGDMVWRLIYGFSALFGVLVLYLTATRGSVLGLVGGIVTATVLVALFERTNFKIRRTAIISLIALVLLVGSFTAIRNTSFVQNNHVLERLSSISIDAGKSRFLIWDMAFQGFRDRPLLGWGQESFNFVFNSYYNPQMYDQESWFDRVHNIFLDWLIAAGAFGLFAYLALYITALVLLWRKKTPLAITERALLTGLLCAYAIHNFFVFDNIASYILFFSLLAYVAAISNEGRPVLLARPLNSVLVDRLLAPIIIVAVIVVLYAVNVKGILAAHDLVRALSSQSSLSVNLSYFNQALARNSFGMQEVREQLTSAAGRIVSFTNVDQETKQQFFDLAKSEMQKQIDAVPGDARFDLFMASLLDTWQQYRAADPYLQRALELSPNKQITLFEIGSNFLNQGQAEGALKAFAQAYTLAPQNRDAAIIYAAGAIYAGQNTLAEEILTKRFGTTLVPDDRLIQAYGRAGQFSKVGALLQKRIDADPNNWETYVSLAAIYLQLGERQKAITAIQKAQSLNADFKAQGDAIIQQIQAGKNP